MKEETDITATSHPGLHYAIMFCGSLHGAYYPDPANLIWRVHEDPERLQALEQAITALRSRGRLAFGLWYMRVGCDRYSDEPQPLPGAPDAEKWLMGVQEHTFDGLGLDGSREGLQETWWGFD